MRYSAEVGRGLGPFTAPLDGVLGLGAARVAAALARAFQARRDAPPGQVIVVGEAIGRALARTGYPVVVVASAPRRRRRDTPPTVVARLPDLPFAPACSDALVCAGLPGGALDVLGRITHHVRDGGLLAVVTATDGLLRRATAREVVAATFIHAALVDVTQARVGSALLTVGRVRAWGSRAGATATAKGWDAVESPADAAPQH